MGQDDPEGIKKEKLRTSSDRIYFVRHIYKIGRAGGGDDGGDHEVGKKFPKKGRIYAMYVCLIL